MKKKQKMYAIIDQFDYADEFDYPVISLFTAKQRKFILKNKNKIPENYEACFGANEYLEFTKEEIIEMFENAKEISKKEIKVLESFNIFEMGKDIYDDLVYMIENPDEF